MNIYEFLGLIFLELPIIIGVIGVIILKIKTGKNWTGQGYENNNVNY